MKTAKEVKTNSAPVYAAALYPYISDLFVKNGYALAVHGSLARDFDLIAVPWVDSPTDPEIIIAELCKTYCMEFEPSNINPVYRPHGRVSYVINIGWGSCYLDLSFMPVRARRGSVVNEQN